MHACKELSMRVRACLASKFIGLQILLCVLKHILYVKHLSCTRGNICVHAEQVRLLVYISSHVLSPTLEQHASFRKNFTEMNASLLHASVKFRLGCIALANTYCATNQLRTEYTLQCLHTMDLRNILPFQ